MVDVCKKLFTRTWRPFAIDDSTPACEGIYAIGWRYPKSDIWTFMYVGHTKNIRKRLRKHFRETEKLIVDKFVHSELSVTGNKGEHLGVKWVKETEGVECCPETFYLNYIAAKIGYRPLLNIEPQMEELIEAEISYEVTYQDAK